MENFCKTYLLFLHGSICLFPCFFIFLGEITLMKGLDRETVSSYQVTIRATDSAPSPFELTTAHIVTIRISDVNDNVPRFGFSSPLVTDVLETVATGEVALSVTASDLDERENGRLVFSIVWSNDTSGMFAFDVNTGKFTVNSEILLIIVISRN